MAKRPATVAGTLLAHWQLIAALVALAAGYAVMRAQVDDLKTGRSKMWERIADLDKRVATMEGQMKTWRME